MRAHWPSLFIGLSLGLGLGFVLAEGLRGRAVEVGAPSDPWEPPQQLRDQLETVRSLCPALQSARAVVRCEAQPCLIWIWLPDGDALEAVDGCPEWPWDNSVSGLLMRSSGHPVWFSDLVVSGQTTDAAQEDEVLRRQDFAQAEALRRLGLPPE